ncbi:MAG TPA: ABC transporter substrate-binding protein [Candidatus Binatia bacterium]|jgi:NitT/TauT family transport system substrate-binding protein
MRKLTVGIDINSLTRRQFLGGTLAAAGAALLPMDLLAAETKLQVGTIPIGDLSPFFIAQQKGFFKEAGLDINAVPMAGGAAIAPALASGALNIGWSNVVSLFQAHLEGFDHRFIVNGAIAKRGTNEVFGVLVAADSPITSAKELDGKTIATNTLSNITQAIGQHWIDHNGGNSSKVKWVEIPFPQMEAALMQKHIDAFVAVEPWMTVPSEVNKKARVLGRAAGGIAPRFMIASFFSSDAWIQKNGDAVKAFVAAWNRGVDAHNADLEEARAAIAKYTKLAPDVMKLVTLSAFEKKIVESDLQPIRDVALRYKLINKKFLPRDVISKLATT